LYSILVVVGSTCLLQVTITKKRLVGSNSQVYQYYDNLHSRLSADFQRRAFLFK